MWEQHGLSDITKGPGFCEGSIDDLIMDDYKKHI